jgi:DnaJ family protein C protein 10
LLQKLEGKVKCGKINCQEHGQLCAKINIRAYPTIRFYNVKKNNWFGEDIQSQDYNYLVNYVQSKLTITHHDEF